MQSCVFLLLLFVLLGFVFVVVVVNVVFEIHYLYKALSNECDHWVQLHLIGPLEHTVCDRLKSHKCMDVSILTFLHFRKSNLFIHLFKTKQNQITKIVVFAKIDFYCFKSNGKTT